MLTVKTKISLHMATVRALFTICNKKLSYTIHKVSYEREQG